MNRKERSAISIAMGLSVAVFLISGCKPDLSKKRRISLQSVQAQNSGSIGHCEEKYGEVFVSIADAHGDCHIFLLEHPDISNKDALSAIKLKKEEMDKRTEQMHPEVQSEGAPSD